jgi:threonine dehydratase
MPEITPKLKINSVRNHGGEWLDIRLVGDTYDDAVAAAHEY